MGSIEDNLKAKEERKKHAIDKLLPAQEEVEAEVEVIEDGVEQQGTEGEEDSTPKTVSEVSNKFVNKLNEKARKKPMEETHERTTFLFKRDLKKRLDALAEGTRGFKTEFFNDAIEALLDETEKNAKSIVRTKKKK